MLRHFWSVGLAVVVVGVTRPGHGQPGPMPPGMMQAAQDTTQIAHDLPPGTIEVVVRDAARKPLPNQPVRLRIVQQSPAIGEKHSERQATTDAQGEARFTGLATASEYAYAAEVPYAGAIYGNEHAPLQRDSGLRVTIHAFPTTRTLDEVEVGAMGIVALEPSDDVFHVTMLVEIVNLGAVTWLPQNYAITLPPGAKAFETDREAALRFEDHGTSVVLGGSVRPGQHRTEFRFQVPNPGNRFVPWAQSDAMRVELGLPPRFLRLSVVADEVPGLRLVVPGFPTAEPDENTTGKPALTTSWLAQDPSDQLPRVQINLAGLPTRGSGPFVTVVACVALLVWGAWGFRRARLGPAPEDVTEARERLLAELAAVEEALARGSIGAKTHAAARRALLAALARLPEDPQRARPPRSKSKSERKRVRSAAGRA